MNRKHFLLQSLMATGYYTIARAEKEMRFFLDNSETRHLVILYTNDQHSRIDPFPDNHPRYAGRGGFAPRAKLIEEFRKKYPHVLLLDSGDIFQGTPYFNFYRGRLELQLMSMMKYDAATLGNHDFDLGMENLKEQFQHASFNFLNCNYDFSDTPLHQHPGIKKYKIFNVGDLRIGITGAGINLSGLVPENLWKGLEYQDPIPPVNQVANFLKNEEGCHLVICLSHLGYQYADSEKVSDIVLARQTENVDIILGGHTHTFIEKPHIVKNTKGRPVYICQAGWAGIWLGIMEVVFSPYKKFSLFTNASREIFAS